MYKNLVSILEKYIARKTLFKHGFNMSPAYRRSTGRVYFVSNDLQTVKVKIPLSYKNKNYKGTMYGGAMSSATDPIYMIQLITILGNDYVVWDKAASIKFKRPVTKTLYANFVLTDDFLEQVKTEMKKYHEKDYRMKVDLNDADGITYSEVERVIYIASKSYYRSKKRR